MDVFISLLHRIMMKLSSFLQDLHRSYERIRMVIPREQTSTRLTTWSITPGKVVESNSRIEQMKHIKSKVRKHHRKFQADRKSSLPETMRVRGSEQREFVLCLIPE